MNHDRKNQDDRRPDNDHDDHDGAMIEVVERIVEGGRAVRQKGIYLLPNLITTAGLFFGFSAILSAMNGHWERAAILIFVAGVMDGLDGRVARMTNTQSAFGAQYDSLADAIAFGLAPAVVVFSWALSGLGKFGYAIGFMYAVCAVMRLARFNVQMETADKGYFAGLPSPAAAAMLAGMVWVAVAYEIDVDRSVALLAAFVTAAAAVLMVSNIRYYSFKDLHAGRVPFFALLLAALTIAVVQTDPPTALWGVALIYAASGPVMEILRRTRRPVED